MEVQYRYKLTRELAPLLGGNKNVLWCMLNPSTATEHLDDPTIRRCMSFSGRVGAARMTVVNLFAARATHPEDLYKMASPVGEENDRMIQNQAKEADLIVAAWGSLENPLAQTRAHAVLRTLKDVSEQTIYCLGKTAKGHPRHPLYVKKDAPLVEFY